MEFYQGETAKYELDLTENGEDYDLSEATAKLAYKKATGDSTIKDCTIADGKVKYTFEPEETSEMLGDYQYQVKVTDKNDDVIFGDNGFISVKKSYFEVA